MTVSTSTAVASILRDLADVLEGKTSLPAAPKAAAPKAARTTAPKTAPEAPVVEGTFPKGCCQGCGKTGMISNPLCGKCRKGAPVEAAPKVSRVNKARGRVEAVTTVVAAEVAPEAPAKTVGRTSPKAHCRAEGCGLFVKAGAKKCVRHAKGAQKAPEAVVEPSLADRLRERGLSEDVIAAALARVGK